MNIFRLLILVTLVQSIYLHQRKNYPGPATTDKAPIVRLYVSPLRNVVALNGTLSLKISNYGPQDEEVLVSLYEVTGPKKQGVWGAYEVTDYAFGKSRSSAVTFKVKHGKMKILKWRPDGQRKNFVPKVGHRYLFNVSPLSASAFNGPYIDTTVFRITSKRTLNTK